jgi:hypothetical protein
MISEVRFDPPYIYHAKLIMIILLCIIYLPFGITDLYLGMYLSNICKYVSYELVVKEYLMIIGYNELLLLIISSIIIITPVRWIHTRLNILYCIIYGATYTIYMIMNIVGLYISIHLECNYVIEYILISIIIKIIISGIIFWLLL